MVIDKIYFITKREKRLAIVLSAIVLTLLVVLIITFFIFAEHIKNSPLIITVIITLFCTLSISDIYNLVKGNLTIGHRLLRYVKFKKSSPMVIVPAITALQNKVCEGVCNDDKGLESLVHIYGFPGKGKTTTAFFVLRGIFLSTKKSVTHVKKIIFIDCSLDRQEILSLFHLDFDKRKPYFDNAIVILDNIEQMGSYFLDVNQELFMSNKNLFILIEDSDNGKTQIQSNVLKPPKQYNFNDNVIEQSTDPDLWTFVDNLSKENKSIFFTIYFTIYCQKYIKIKYVAEISETHEEQVLKLLKTIETKGREKKKNVPFAIFPFNEEYVYCPDSIVLEIIPKRYKENEIYNEVLYKCIQSKYFDKEGKWLCFIQNNSTEIGKINQNERIRLFNKALTKGHFKFLYNSLNIVIKLDKAIKKVSEKEQLLFYEYGVLSYYMGLHQQAFNLYQKHLKLIDDNHVKMRLLIRIIESVHGSSDNDVVLHLQTYIGILRSDPYYKLYADYWQTHIGLEKGKFDIQGLHLICSKIQEIKPAEDDFLYTETVKRCYTDLIRCHHLLGLHPDNELENEFETFLKNTNREMYEYSFNLYIKAGNLQYIDIPQSKFEDKDTKTVLEMVNDAKRYYNEAINSEYGDQKSRLALSVKQADLTIILTDTKIIQAIHIAECFLMHAQNNNARLHEAYAETILAKFKMLNNNTFQSTNSLHVPHYLQEDIEKHIENARNIYEKYDNIYGVFRLDFIQLLYMLYIGTEYKDIIELMQDLIEKHSSYIKERSIYINLHERNHEKRLSKMYIQWCIRSYMIVLQ